MLAALARELPHGPYLYEPKWDGFRALAFVDGADVDLRSRHDRPLGRYFPELVAALGALGGEVVLDGEIVIEGDFAALMNRTHPAASRVARLAAETPATYVAFDLLGDGGEDLTARRFVERRARLEARLAGAPPAVRVTPATGDADAAARWLGARAGGGIDGVVAKHHDLPYAPGKRAMIKVKPERTADCVVAGVRVTEAGVGSLLLGLWDGDVLRHVGVVSQLTAARRRALLDELAAEVVPIEAHPWERGFGIGGSPIGRLPGAAGRWDPAEMTRDWTPLAGTRVAEVAYDHLDGARFRHPARLVRWRPDREPRSCTFEQLR